MFETRKRKKLEAHRAGTLVEIREETSKFELMVQRAERAADQPDAKFVKKVRDRLNEIEEQAKTEINSESFDGQRGKTITIESLHLSAN